MSDTDGVIVTVVRIQGVGPLTVDEAQSLFSQNAAGYLEVPGLVAKTFLLSENGQDTGAVYWWRDRESAKAKFSPGWFEGVGAKYGAPPTVEYFEAPIHVDVVNQVIRGQAPLG